MSERTTAEIEPNGETTIDSTRDRGETGRTLRWGAYLIAVSGLGLVANALAMLYRALFTDAFEAGVGTLGGLTRAELAASNHEVAHYITHLHVNVAGLLAAVGIAVIALAWFGVRRGRRWALSTAVALPAVFLAHSLPIHSSAGFSYDAVQHLGPGAVWLPALIAGAALAYRGLTVSDRQSAGRPAADD